MMGHNGRNKNLVGYVVNFYYHLNGRVWDFVARERQIKLSYKADSRDNNFDFIRFIAASLVIVSHSFALYRTEFEPFTWLTGYCHFGYLGVQIFFVISGFLITKSWLDNPFIITFVKKRFLRIFPALICAVLFGAFIIGPLTTSLGLKNYIGNVQTYMYLKNILLFQMVYALPGVFTNNPYPIAVNGSLWTLSIEITMYAAIILFGSVKILKRKNTLLILLVILLYLDIFVLNQPKYLNKYFLNMGIIHLVKFSILFSFGSIYYLYRDKIIINNTILYITLFLYIFSWRTSYGEALSYIALPYIIIYIAYARIPWLVNFSKHGDFSYGMYVYAFPVQQTVIHFLKPHLAIWSFFTCAFLITFFIAILSWRYVEKPSLKLKKINIMETIKTYIYNNIFKGLKKIDIV
jgi:peptidoglycan/LPS O-acetylase OafA/YrhL